MSNTVQTPEIKLDTNMAEIIAASAIETISTMTGLQPVAGKIEHSQDLSVHADISGIVTIIQERVEGALIVSFPKETIFHILARIYRQPFLEINTSVQQGVGEFANIIYGIMKTNLNKSGYKLKMALPHVVMGDQHKVVNTLSQPIMIVPLTISSQYTFHVTLQIHKT